MAQPDQSARLTQAQRATLERAQGNGGYWFPYGAGEWHTARILATRGLAARDWRLSERYGRFIVTAEGRAALDDERAS